MHTNQAIGLPVISASDGEKLGTLSRIYFDTKRKRIVGFAFNAGGGLLSPDSEPNLDATCVQALGADALVISGKESVLSAETDARFAELDEIGRLANRPIMTVSGQANGKVAGVEFDPMTFWIDAIHVARGRFERETVIPESQILAIGPDYVIVAE
jgi:uncharacterized protein YrrD